MFTICEFIELHVHQPLFALEKKTSFDRRTGKLARTGMWPLHAIC